MYRAEGGSVMMRTSRKERLKAAWTGPLRFGLVSIPVKAYPARIRESGDIDLIWLHRDCFSHIQVKQVCPVHGEVGNEEIVSGYEGSSKGPRPSQPSSSLIRENRQDPC